MGGSYGVNESDHFCLLSNVDSGVVRQMLAKAEQSRDIILETLRGVACDEGYGKHVIVSLSDRDDFVSYLAYFTAHEGHTMFPGGVYLDHGYGHFVLHYDGLFSALRIVTHELTHVCLAHKPLPTWLNEGIALNMEELVADDAWGSNLRIDRELKGRHSAYWNEETIQPFWNGESFHSPDDASELSYSMAALMTFNIGQSYGKLSELAAVADADDHGASACREVLKVELEDLITGFLGEGNWAPKSAQDDEHEVG